MTIPALPSLDRTSATFKTDLDAFFLTQLPATIPAFNAEAVRINSIGFGSYSASSTTSLVVGSGSKSLTIDTGKAFGIGQAIILTSTASPSTYMNGNVTAHNSTTGALTVEITDFAGSGTLASWAVNVSAQVLRPTKIGDVFQGTTKPTAGTWLPLDGSIYLQSSYATLFALLGVISDNPSAVQTATEHTLPSSSDWYSVAYGGGVFVAISGSSTAAASSADGATWTARTLPSAANWRSVAYGNGVFVAVATGSTSAATSPDGITWTARTLPSSSTWIAVNYGNGVFVAVTSGGTVAATSPDGITWTARTTTAGNWSAITFGNGIFVAVSSGTTQAATSPDGITWTARTLPSAANWRSVAYGNGGFVAVASGGAIAATSPDGITWTARTTPTANWFSVSFGGGLFYAVGSYSTVAATSPDGVNWTARTLPSSAGGYSVTYGNGLFVTVPIGPSTSAARAGPVVTYDPSTQFYVPAATNTPGISQWIRGL